MANKKNSAVKNIFEINFGLKETEKVLVISDVYNESIKKIAKLVAKTGTTYSTHVKYYEYIPTGCHGVEPPEDLWAEAFGKEVYVEMSRKNLFKPVLLKKTTKNQINEIEKIIKRHKDKAVNVVIALSYYSTSHTKFRDLLNRICGVRYASMPLFDEKMLSGPMTVDWKKMSELTKKIASKINNYDGIKIESNNGTSVIFSKKGREAKMDTGIITKPGQFSNLPAGEVYLAPVEGTATGRLVLEWAPTRKLKSPVVLHIEKGEVKRIEGNEKYIDYLEEKFSERRENRNIAELGIGTNNKASRPDNILESEKILGTIHIALGDNSSFGGKVRTSFHQDFILFNPTITLMDKNHDNKKIMDNGKLLIK
ncbi:MAG: peptidase [Nitrospiraceae bacterium]|nr:MAG: peptidase [Nitrospiraceae bacterium]